MSATKISGKPRDTIFCEGNEKDLYPVKYGRRRVGYDIFKEQKYDPHLRTSVDRTSTKVTKQRPEIVEARNLSRGDLYEEKPQGKGKGELNVGVLEQSLNVDPYGFKPMKKPIGQIDCLKYNQVVVSDKKNQRTTSPVRERRIGKYMHSTGVKDSIESS